MLSRSQQFKLYHKAVQALDEFELYLAESNHYSEHDDAPDRWYELEAYADDLHTQLLRRSIP